MKKLLAITLALGMLLSFAAAEQAPTMGSEMRIENVVVTINGQEIPLSLQARSAMCENMAQIALLDGDQSLFGVQVSLDDQVASMALEDMQRYFVVDYDAALQEGLVAEEDAEMFRQACGLLRESGSAFSAMTDSRQYWAMQEAGMILLRERMQQETPESGVLDMNGTETPCQIYTAVFSYEELEALVLEMYRTIPGMEGFADAYDEILSVVQEEMSYDGSVTIVLRTVEGEDYWEYDISSERTQAGDPLVIIHSVGDGDEVRQHGSMSGDIIEFEYEITVRTDESGALQMDTDISMLASESAMPMTTAEMNIALKPDGSGSVRIALDVPGQIAMGIQWDQTVADAEFVDFRAGKTPVDAIAMDDDTAGDVGMEMLSALILDYQALLGNDSVTQLMAAVRTAFPEEEYGESPAEVTDLEEVRRQVGWAFPELTVLPEGYTLSYCDADENSIALRYIGVDGVIYAECTPFSEEDEYRGKFYVVGGEGNAEPIKNALVAMQFEDGKVMVIGVLAPDEWEMAVHFDSGVTEEQALEIAKGIKAPVGEAE